MKISVIIPVYNEEKFVLSTLKKVNLQKKNFEIEIIVVDDNSTDQTNSLLENNNNLYDKMLKNDRNLGKGGSFKRGLSIASGDLILIQDADDEYDPNEYSKLIEPFQKYNADVVLGSRFKGSGAKRIIYYSHQLANKILTLFCNVILNNNFSDIETGYKVFKKELIDKINLEQNDFGIEIELIMKMSRLKSKIYEVGIDYNGRSYEEGKKIRLKDGIKALYLIFFYAFKKKL
jgi:glycosyltransferase involved in cell wall biosynthesis|tara:strand:- start:34 stop:729 length:696 start_codon:yes stop_codon:yes gene_type:complete